MKKTYAIVQRFPGDGTRYAVWRSTNLGGTREYLQINGTDAIFPNIQTARDAMRAWSKRDKVTA